MGNVLIFDSIEALRDYSKLKGKIVAVKVTLRYSSESYIEFYMSYSEKDLFESLLFQGNIFRLDFYEYKDSFYAGDSNYVNPSKIRNIWMERV